MSVEYGITKSNFVTLFIRSCNGMRLFILNLPNVAGRFPPSRLWPYTLAGWSDNWTALLSLQKWFESGFQFPLETVASITHPSLVSSSKPKPAHLCHNVWTDYIRSFVTKEMRVRLCQDSLAPPFWMSLNCVMCLCVNENEHCNVVTLIFTLTSDPGRWTIFVAGKPLIIIIRECTAM